MDGSRFQFSHLDSVGGVVGVHSNHPVILSMK